MTEYSRILQPTRLFIMLCLASLSLYYVSSIIAARPAFAEERSIRFWHWWNSAGEIKNIDVLSRHLKQHNLQWKDKDAKSSSTSLYLAHINDDLKDQLPEAAMLDSSEAHNFDKAFSLMHLDDIAQEQNWEDVIPLAIQVKAKHQGHWVSAPLNSHSNNWLWINKDLFLRLNMPEPQTWDDLIAVLEQAKKLGIPALAAMHDDWEQALLFELTAMSTGGLGFYRRLFVDEQIESTDLPLLANSLLRLKQLNTYFAENTLNQSWDQNTAQLAQGQVLMQVHGSWVNSELSSLGTAADIDYLCLRFPDTQGAYIFHSDHVVFFKAAYNNINSQKELARILLDKEFQRELSIASGASPARVDVSTEGFNSCSEKNIYDLRMANMRRAVMPSINNKALEKTVADYLAQRITLDAAVHNVLITTIRKSMHSPSSHQ